MAISDFVAADSTAFGRHDFETEAQHYIEYIERLIRTAANPYPRDGSHPLYPEIRGYRLFRLSIRSMSKARLQMKKMVRVHRRLQTETL